MNAEFGIISKIKITEYANEFKPILLYHENIPIIVGAGLPRPFNKNLSKTGRETRPLHIFTFLKKLCKTK